MRVAQTRWSKLGHPPHTVVTLIVFKDFRGGGVVPKVGKRGCGIYPALHGRKNEQRGGTSSVFFFSFYFLSFSIGLPSSSNFSGVWSGRCAVFDFGLISVFTLCFHFCSPLLVLLRKKLCITLLSSSSSSSSFLFHVIFGVRAPGQAEVVLTPKSLEYLVPFLLLFDRLQ